MLEFAVISDVHANLEALNVVLKRVEGREIYCLGDLVDYGANPNEVIDVVRQRGVKSIIGNHDVAALDGDTSLFNPRAAMSSKWTASRLTPSSVEYLRGLERDMRFRLEEVDVYLTHGSPDDKLWEYVDPRTHSELFWHYLDKTRTRLMGLGHTHLPYVWEEDGRVVFNPGSVGQPRDGDRRASYALVSIEGDRARVNIQRVDYDIEAAASKIRSAGLPESNAGRLFSGG